MVDKVVIGPFKSVTDPPTPATVMSTKSQNIKEKIFGKIHRLLKIIMKLAKFDGYDSNGKIRLPNGSYMEKSSLVDLLTHAMSAGRMLIGEDAFIDLLRRANIEPDLIINENVRAKLIAAYNNNKNNNNRPIETTDQEPRLYATPPTPTLSEPQQASRVQKRTLEIDDDDDDDDDDIVELPTKRIRSEDNQPNKHSKTIVDVDDSWWDNPMSKSIPPPPKLTPNWYIEDGEDS